MIWPSSTPGPSLLLLVWFLLYAHSHRGIVGAAGHITLTPANQLMVVGLKIWSLSNPGFELATFRSLAQRAYHLHLSGPPCGAMGCISDTRSKGMEIDPLSNKSKVRLFLSVYINRQDCSGGTELVGPYSPISWDGYSRLPNR
jgi:hypothetical protein